MSPSFCCFQKSHCVCLAQALAYVLLTVLALALIFIALTFIWNGSIQRPDGMILLTILVFLCLSQISLICLTWAGRHTSLQLTISPLLPRLIFRSFSYNDQLAQFSFCYSLSRCRSYGPFLVPSMRARYHAPCHLHSHFC